LLHNLDNKKKIRDAELFYTLINTLGPYSAKYITGDWISVIYDFQSEILLVFRDTMGISNLIIYENDQNIYFSSDYSTLKQYSNAAFSLDINNFLMYVNFELINKVNTYLHGVRYMKSGSYIRIEQNNVSTFFYQNIDKITRLYYKDKRDYYYHFRDLFVKLLNSRIKESIYPGSTLSSGLDSASITAVLASILNDDSKRLFGFSFKPLPRHVKHQRGNSYIYDETEFNKYISLKYNNLDIIEFQANEYSPLDAIELTSKIFGILPNTLINMYWICSMMSIAYQTGIDILFIGQNGNNTISWPYKIIANSLANPLNYVKRKLKHSAKRVLNNYKLSSNVNPANILIPINTKFARKIRSVPKQDILINSIEKPTKLRLDSMEYLVNRSGSFWYSLGNAFNIKITDPTSDPEIINFCLSIPPKVFYNKNGSRLLIKEGLKEYLPYQYILNKKKGFQAQDLDLRLYNEIDRVFNYIDILKKSSLCNELLDINELESTAINLKNNKYLESSVSMNRLINGLSIGIILTNL